jgi:hypothetical protein
MDSGFETIDGIEVLMLRGTVGRCPDCGDDRLLLPTDGFDGYCCTSCDAAVFAPALEVLARGDRPGVGLARRLAG